MNYFVPTVIFLNGPPRCGKTTIARALAPMVGGTLLPFARALKLATHAAYGINDEGDDAMFEHEKDIPLPAFFNLTPRQAYIHHSENYFKPLHGKFVFGALWLRQADHMLGDMSPVGVGSFIVPDSGFEEEALAVIQRVGAERCLLARLHRPGTDFRNDSRSYIDLAGHGVTSIDVDNIGPPTTAMHHIRAAMQAHGLLRVDVARGLHTRAKLPPADIQPNPVVRLPGDPSKF